MKKIFFSLFLFSYLYASNIQPKTMENPWYTGPLLTPSATNLYPEQWNIQPYVFYSYSNKIYNTHGGHRFTPEIKTWTLSSFFQTGILNWLDITAFLSGNFTEKEGYHASTFSDLSVIFGIQLLREKFHTKIPSIRLTLTEKFPTGKYQHLSPEKDGIDAGGNGSYETIIGLRFSKVIYWFPEHPINFRLTFSESFPSKVHVHDFHAWGGGYGTNGKISPSYIFTTAFSFEWSLTRRWVIASDFLFNYNTKITFKGNPGLSFVDTIADNETGISYLFSMAPAIEFNINHYSGIIGGVWFSIFGRNSTEFLQGVLSYTVTF